MIASTASSTPIRKHVRPMNFRIVGGAISCRATQLKALGVGNNITFLKETKTSRFSVITSCQIIFKEEIALKITMPGIAILRESNKWSRDPEFNPEKIIISLSYTWHYLRTRRPLVQRSVAETRSQDDVEK